MANQTQTEPPYYGVLNDMQILELCESQAMISPHVSALKTRRFLTPADATRTTERIISYGVSSYGYDVRAAPHFKVFKPRHRLGDVDVIDPKNFDVVVCDEVNDDVIIVPPNGFILAHTIETITMPPDVTALVIGKSTYARVGLVCICTPLEAGWSGQITLEFANTTPRPIMFYAHEGCAQLVFFKGQRCKTSYADREGKYQNQQGVTFPKV